MKWLDRGKIYLQGFVMNEVQLKNNLKKLRVISDMTQEQLADAVGVTRQTIIAIEKGNYIPSTLLALRLAVRLSCIVEDLFYESHSEIEPD
jgi:putative transcriptional regulator